MTKTIHTGKGVSITLVLMLIGTMFAGLFIPANVFLGTVSAAGGSFGGGNGTAGNPYIIEDLLDLQNMSANLSAHYVLGNDIDASNTSVLGHLSNNGGLGFAPIANDDTDPMTSGFQGTPFTGSLEGNGFTISNLYINRSAEDYVGLIGYNSGTISNCYSTGDVSGDVSGDSYVGGLVGYNNGNIANCYSTGDASGDWYVGGLVGISEGGIIVNCHSIGNASGIYYIGGLVGYSTGSISNCSATGDAHANEEFVGGLVGWNNGGSIENCHSTGNASASGIATRVGGLVGRNDGNITGCHSTGDASGDYSVGGLVGYNNGGTITDSYSTGNASGDWNVGGLVGYNTGGTITDSYSTGNANGDDRVGGLVGYNSGTVSNCSSTGDVSGTTNVGGFTGDNGNTITNCHSTGNAIGTDDNVGGFVGRNEGTISECSSTGNVSGDEDVGGFVGRNEGTISECIGTGDTSGTTEVGGFAGINVGTPTAVITNCYSTGNASGSNKVGGFAGLIVFFSITNNSYSTGNASGNTFVGGFAGDASTTISGCFWDKQTSGLITSEGGTGKNTSEMMRFNQYATAGWDFTNIWDIRHTHTYPFFRWGDRNYVPLAVDDEYTISEDNILAVSASGVLTDDHDWDGDALTVITFDAASAQGAVVNVNADGSFTYEPTSVPGLQVLAVGEWVVDSFTYTISDGTSTDTATVYVNVTGVNDAPTAADEAYATDEDTLLNIAAPGLLANATDVDANDTLEIIPDTFLTAKGATVVISASGPFTYDPRTSAELQALAVGEFTIDSFTYIVDDGNGGMDTGKVTVTVNGMNDAPTISTSNDGEAVEGRAYTVDYDALDIDTSDVLAWTLATNATWLGINAGTGVLTGTAVTGIYYAHVTVNDGHNGHNGTDSTNFTLRVYSDEDDDGTPDYMDPDFLAYETIVNNTVWNNQTVNQTVYSNNTVNQTVWQNSTSNVTIGVSDADSDGDGWTDAIEIAGGTDPLDATDKPMDSDGDGIADFMDPGEAETVTTTETPAWAWGAVIAAIVLGVVVAITIVKGRGGKPETAPEPTREIEEPQP